MVIFSTLLQRDELLRGLPSFMTPVPKEGIEPSFLSEHDFESCASAYSATSAGW
jgi:hypothetical protein